jgi:hypothetical protein
VPAATACTTEVGSWRGDPELLPDFLSLQFPEGVGGYPTAGAGAGRRDPAGSGHSLGVEGGVAFAYIPEGPADGFLDVVTLVPGLTVDSRE